MAFGRICLRPFGAQLVSAPFNRRYASGRLGLNLLLCRFKTCSFPNEKGPHKGALYSFW